MIESFKHPGLQLLFTRNSKRGLASEIVGKLEIVLRVLNPASAPRDIGLPGFGLHPLKGNRKGTWAVKVTGNLRVTFRLENGNAVDVNLEDYH